NISVARQIIPQLSVGLGLNILDGSLKCHAKKVTPLYTYTLDMKAEGIQLQGILGLLYRPLEYLAVGVSYKRGSQAEFKGDASVTYPFPVGVNLVVLQEESDYTQRLLVPVQIGLGVAYTAIEKLILTADWARTDWSDFYKDIDYKVEGDLFKDSKVDQQWMVSDRIRLGVEYCLVRDLAIRAGFGLDPRGVSDRAVSQTNLIDTDRKIISFGLGYEWNNIAADLGYVYAFGKETIQDVEYEKNTSGLVSSLHYKF
ncbi:MAG: outer membrane protein transport protein, partial [Candidatus Latescibacteria bacterium]|nr:outer membrane protein transport protein [Candidatus Latescibacterota bacterium]